jgi:hypothetical protein
MGPPELLLPLELSDELPLELSDELSGSPEEELSVVELEVPSVWVLGPSVVSRPTVVSALTVPGPVVESSPDEDSVVTTSRTSSAHAVVHASANESEHRKKSLRIARSYPGRSPGGAGIDEFHPSAPCPAPPAVCARLTGSTRPSTFGQRLRTPDRAGPAR